MIFLFMVLGQGGCGFNFIPYAIHENLTSNPRGENFFINTFDIVVSVCMFLLVYKIATFIQSKKSK